MARCLRCTSCGMAAESIQSRVPACRSSLYIFADSLFFRFSPFHQDGSRSLKNLYGAKGRFQNSYQAPMTFEQSLAATHESYLKVQFGISRELIRLHRGLLSVSKRWEQSVLEHLHPVIRTQQQMQKTRGTSAATSVSEESRKFHWNPSRNTAFQNRFLQEPLDGKLTFSGEHKKSLHHKFLM